MQAHARLLYHLGPSVVPHLPLAVGACCLLFFATARPHAHMARRDWLLFSCRAAGRLALVLEQLWLSWGGPGVLSSLSERLSRGQHMPASTQTASSLPGLAVAIAAHSLVLVWQGQEAHFSGRYTFFKAMGLVAQVRWPPCTHL